MGQTKSKEEDNIRRRLFTEYSDKLLVLTDLKYFINVEARLNNYIELLKNRQKKCRKETCKMINDLIDTMKNKRNDIRIFAKMTEDNLNLPKRSILVKEREKYSEDIVYLTAQYEKYKRYPIGTLIDIDEKLVNVMAKYLGYNMPYNVTNKDLLERLKHSIWDAKSKLSQIDSKIANYYIDIQNIDISQHLKEMEDIKEIIDDDLRRYDNQYQQIEKQMKIYGKGDSIDQPESTIQIANWVWIVLIILLIIIIIIWLFPRENIDLSTYQYRPNASRIITT